jgi:hypothetical protein
VIQVTDSLPRDVTTSYEIVSRANFLATHRKTVDAGDPLYSSRLGPTWHRAENGFRWMPKTATVDLGGPASPSERLYVTGYGAAQVLAAGPVSLRFRVDGMEIGTGTVSKADEAFAFDFPLPAESIGRYSMQVSIEVSKTLRLPGDSRELGMIFGTFAIH